MNDEPEPEPVREDPALEELLEPTEDEWQFAREDWT